MQSYIQLFWTSGGLAWRLLYLFQNFLIIQWLLSYFVGNKEWTMPAHYEEQIRHWTDCYRISPSVPTVPDNHGFYEIRDVPLWYQYDSSHYREDDEDSALIDVCTYSQTCIKRSLLIWDKANLVLWDRWPLKRGSIHMKFSMTEQEKGDLLIQVTA